MLQDPKTVKLKNKYRQKIQDKIDQYGPEILAGAVALGGLALWGFYMLGVKDGKRMFAHGPCMEITADAAEGLLQGKFMITKVIGDDLFYKIVDVDVDALLP